MKEAKTFIRHVNLKIEQNYNVDAIQLPWMMKRKHLGDQQYS